MKEIIRYACPYCNAVYDKEYEAENCARECVHIEDPDEVYGFECEMCGEQYNSEENAMSCEDEHKASEDKFYQDYSYRKNFEQLDAAAKLNGQTRLN